MSILKVEELGSLEIGIESSGEELVIYGKGDHKIYAEIRLDEVTEKLGIGRERCEKVLENIITRDAVYFIQIFASERLIVENGD